MSTDYKINQLKKSIENNHLKEFQFKLNEVLSFTESPIETILLLQFMNYFIITFKGDYLIPNKGIEFLEDEFSHAEQKNIDRANKYSYRFDGVDSYSKYNGFKVNGGTVRSSRKDYSYLEIEFYPQYEVLINNSNYRLDIAVIINTKYYQTDEIEKTAKVAIECDGYDYHKQPEKFKEDKIRERNLKALGWKEVLRYSGSEIYQTGDNLEKTHYNFKEIMDIFRL